jgi:hypothetical protein
MDLWTRMMNCFTKVCVESTIVFVLKPQELNKPAPKPQPPRGFALRLRRGRAVQSKSAGREANAPEGLAFASLGLPCFLLASGRRRQKTGNQAAQKKQRRRFTSPCHAAKPLQK